MSAKVVVVNFTPSHQGRLPLDGGRKTCDMAANIFQHFMYTLCVSSSYLPEDGAISNLYLDGTEDC